MWTPKRVLLWLLGLGLLTGVYFFYARYLGGIDGLTPMPDAYLPGDSTQGGLEMRGPPESRAVKKLRMAFGNGCPEIRPEVTKLDMPTRGIVLAIEDFKILDNDPKKIELKPFSIALFKHHPGELWPEINTIRSKVAVLELEQPIKTIWDLGKSKIVGAVLKEDIHLVNNRRSPEVADDLSLYTNGTVYYSEAEHRIWTKDAVKLMDIKSQPEPTTITALGMLVFLKTAPATPQNTTAHAKAKGGEKITDVERVEFPQNVRMDLWVDQNSGFLAGEKKDDQPKALATFVGPPSPAHIAEAPKSKIVITTDGKFVYDLTTSKAEFFIPNRVDPSRPEYIQVVRENLSEPGKRDQLDCDHLSLQFVRRTPSPGQKATETDNHSLEIQTAHATASNTLHLHSDSEALDAFGNDLIYDAPKKLSILKGVPMVAMKDGNEIHARELWLEPATQPGAIKDSKQAVAIGPGSIKMLDRNIEGDAMVRNVQAKWDDKLIHYKEASHDCLILTGSASFDDPRNEQRLRADYLKVWLEPGGSNQPGDAAEKRLRPHHIEAKGHVKADSPDMHVKEPTENLAIWFEDAPAKKIEFTPIPAIPAAAEPTRTAALSPPPIAPIGASPTLPPSAIQSQPPKPSAPKAEFVGPSPEKPKPPINLSARSVEVHILRSGQKSDLDRLWCEHDVFVHQDPEDPQKDEGMDIRGDTLDLNNSPQGGVLLVESKTLAHVKFDKLYIIGPKVEIDQPNNKARVDGTGAMRMQSKTNFDGSERKEPTNLTIQWRDRMLFTGANAEFFGHIQAFQENSRLLCEQMQAAFDKPVSLKQGSKNGPSPKVDRLTCSSNQTVYIEEIVLDESLRKLYPDISTLPRDVLTGIIKQGKVQSVRYLKSPEVHVDNTEKQVQASGPGQVRIFQPGSADDPLKPAQTQVRAAKPATSAPPPKNGPVEYKVIHVRYQGRMYTSTGEHRRAIFYDDVEAVHGPADLPDVAIDVDHLPAGFMYLRCEKLTVFSVRQPDGHNCQEMIAEKNVTIKGNNYYGDAARVKYDEALDRIILEGDKGSPAHLYHVAAPGAEPDPMTGMKIFYYRKTGTFDVKESTGLSAH